MTDIVALGALAPLLALVGALINGLLGRWLKEPLPGILATALVAAGFVVSLVALAGLWGRDEGVSLTLWRYLSAGDFELTFGFKLDNLSVLMMLIITGVGALIHLYSIGYMRGDPGYSRYFAGLNLFVAAMLVLVMADTYLLMFIGWEGVGVCSYLLIGFWYREKLNADAARKAFIVNRIGDVGFLLAMFLTFKTFGTLNIAAVNDAAAALIFVPAAVTTIGLLYLLAAAGKSAQLPLQVWLPDAMAGPTPVSALIHAATMVTAGVYLIARSAPLFAASPEASATVAWVGALTALLGAFAALSQTDIKRVLAYSTISQLGFMIAAVGAGAYWAGVFHLFTHAFFKALLFLAAGSVIHALNGEQDMTKMGGLGKYLKVTGRTALIGTLAIAGVPLLAGFFSKEAILAYILASDLVADSAIALYLILLITAGLTALYMFRWYYRVFAGPERLSKEAKAHLHESPPVMTVPLVILAFFSITAGYIGLPAFAFPNAIAPWLKQAIGDPVRFTHPAVWVEWLLLLLAVLVAAAGLGLGAWIYHYQSGAPTVRLKRGFVGQLARLSQAGGGFDPLYRWLFVSGAQATAEALDVLDQGAIDRGARGLAGGVPLLARAVTLWQSGYVRHYALSILLGAALLALLLAILGVTA